MLCDRWKDQGQLAVLSVLCECTLQPRLLAVHLALFPLLPLQSRMPVYIAHTPAGTSVQNIVHLAQVGHDRQTDRQTDRHTQSHGM